MVSIEDSIPSFSESYLYGQDIFWEQFNDVSFFVEDSELEELYHQILKKLFPKIRIEKIFPLDGKKNVIDDAKENLSNKQKVYIVDKDFDDLHGKIENIENLFYLDRYCIENYLFEGISILEFVVSENPKLKKRQILEVYNIDEQISLILEKLLYINSLFYIVQKTLFLSKIRVYTLHIFYKKTILICVIKSWQHTKQNLLNSLMLIRLK